MLKTEIIRDNNSEKPPERVLRSTWLDFSSQGPPFTSVVDTLSSVEGKVPVKEGRDELDIWLVPATTKGRWVNPRPRSGGSP